VKEVLRLQKRWTHEQTDERTYSRTDGHMDSVILLNSLHFVCG